MKNMKVLIVILLIVVNQSCDSNKINKNREVSNFLITKDDSLYVEESLLHYKNVLFSRLYNTSKEETYKKKQLEFYDTLPDITYYYYNLQNLRWYPNDNLNKLLRKWLDKNEFYISKVYPPEHPDGSLDLARALAFYNSDDLKNHLDSLRQVEYKRIIEEVYKNR